MEAIYILEPCKDVTLILLYSKFVCSLLVAFSEILQTVRGITQQRMFILRLVG